MEYGQPLLLLLLFILNTHIYGLPTTDELTGILSMMILI